MRDHLSDDTTTADTTTRDAPPPTAGAIVDAHARMRRLVRRAARAQLRAERAAAIVYGSPDCARAYVARAIPAALLIEQARCRARRKDGVR